MPLVNNSVSASIATRLKLRQAQQLNSKKVKKFINDNFLYLLPVLTSNIDSFTLQTLPLIKKPFFDDFYKDSIAILADDIFIKELLLKIPMLLGSIALYEVIARNFHFFTKKDQTISNQKDYKSPFLSESEAKKEIDSFNQRDTQQRLQDQELSNQFIKACLFFYLAYKVVTTLNSKSMDELLYLLLIISDFTLTLSGILLKTLALKIFIDKPNDHRYLPYLSQSISELFPQNCLKQTQYEQEIFITLTNIKKIKFFSLILGSNLEKIGFEAIIADEEQLVIRHLDTKQTSEQHQQNFQYFKKQAQIALQQSQEVAKNIERFKKCLNNNLLNNAKHFQFRFSYNLDTGSVTACITLQIKDSTNTRIKKFFEQFELLESPSDQIILSIKDNSIDWLQEIKNFESHKKELLGTAVIQPTQEEKKPVKSQPSSSNLETSAPKKIKVKTRAIVIPRPDWMIDLANDEEVVSTTTTKKPAHLEMNGEAITIKEKYFKPLTNKDGITTTHMLFFHPSTRKTIKKTDAHLYSRFQGLWEQPKTCAPQGENGFKKFTQGKKGWEAKLIGVDARMEGKESTATLTYDDGSQAAIDLICFDTFISKAHR